MTTIAKDFSPPALVRAIRDNWFERYALIGRSPAAELTQNPNWTALTSRVPFYLLNAVLRARWTPEHEEEVLNQILMHFESRAILDFIWWIEPHAQSENLGDRLVDHGFAFDEGPIGMAVDLQKLNEETVPSNLVIKRVLDRESLKIFIRTMAVGFGLTEPVERAFLELYTGFGYSFPIELYVGYQNQAPVAVAQLFLGAGCAGIYAVVTLPEARRQGIGAAMTLAALRKARTLGYRIGVVHSTEMGLGLYRRLGFREYCRMSHYRWSGSCL